LHQRGAFLAFPEPLGQPAHTRGLGKSGEEKAAQYLTEKGYDLIERNYQRRQGELDIVAQDPSGTLIFIEVKSAFGDAAGDPGCWVDKKKQQQIGRVAKVFLAERGWMERACRFDVLTLWSHGGKSPEIRHYENAFMLSYAL
jgi:putative endonuclease